MSYKDYLGILLPKKMKPSQVLEVVNNEKGKANGLASLNSSGQIPSSQLPSYVDDVLEFDEFNDFPIIGETGKIYLDKDAAKIYRWSGSMYVEIPSLYQYLADGQNYSVLLGDIGNNTASGGHSIAEGSYTAASNEEAHAEGLHTVASGRQSHSEGSYTVASGHASHAQGDNTQAQEEASHAEGMYTVAIGVTAHVEGNASTASGESAHAEGNYTLASGSDSHTEGYYATAFGNYSHAEGQNTIAKGRSQHVFGEYNIEDDFATDADYRGKYVEIVGNGDGDDTRSNARTLDWEGNAEYAGDVIAYGCGGTDPISMSTMYDNINNLYQQLASGSSMPVPPSDNGFYVLTVNVIDNTPVYQWKRLNTGGLF